MQLFCRLSSPPSLLHSLAFSNPMYRHLPKQPQRNGPYIICQYYKDIHTVTSCFPMSHSLTLKVLNFWKFTSYCSLKPLWSGMGEVVPARTSPTLHPPSPPTVHQLSWLALQELILNIAILTNTPVTHPTPIARKIWSVHYLTVLWGHSYHLILHFHVALSNAPYLNYKYKLLHLHLYLISVPTNTPVTNSTPIPRKIWFMGFLCSTKLWNNLSVLVAYL